MTEKNSKRLRIVRFLSLLLTTVMLVTAQGFITFANTVSQNNTQNLSAEKEADSRQTIMSEDIVVPTNPVHHCTKKNDGTDYTDFSYVYFGSYPQSEVTDSKTIAAIDSAIAAGNGTASANDNIIGADVWVNGTKYLRIGSNDYRYFRWERIKWRVLDNDDDGTLFVAADKALDCIAYDDEGVESTWEESTIRSWLNGSFYQSAFSSAEQSAIASWHIMNEDNPEYGTEGGNDTTDWIYLLSIEEVTDERYGFCSDSDTYSASHWVLPSSYAQTMGTFIYSDNDIGYQDSCDWWLRSPGPYSFSAAYVRYDGYVDVGKEAVAFMELTIEGVVPALHINLSSDLWHLTDDGTSGEGGGILTGGNQNPSTPQPDPSQPKYSGTDGDLDWTIDTEGHLVISGTGDYDSRAWLDYSDEIKSATVQVTGITGMSNMFCNCSNLSNVDVRGLDTSNVADMSYMFSWCSSLSSLDLSGFDTSNVTDMSGMFFVCSGLSSLDLSGFDTSNVTDMADMFFACSSLSSVDVRGFNTENVTNMGAMFSGCSNLNSVDVSGFHTRNVTDMDNMFSGCSNLDTLDVSGLDTSNVTDMSGMFSNCSSLSSVDISGLDTSNVTDMCVMFGYCYNLRSVNVSGLDTSNVMDMSYMFCDCFSLSSVDISGLDMSNAMDMSSMFSGCISLVSLDVSGFNIGDTTYIIDIFYACNSLTTLTLPANIQQSVELPYWMYDSANDCYVKSDSFVWQDSNGQTCEYAIMNLPTKMTYKKVMKGQENPSNPQPEPSQPDSSQPVAPQPTGTSLTASQVTSRTDTVPQGAAFTVTSSDSANPTVSFDGVSDENAKAVTIPKTITYNGVEYKVTTVSPTAFSTKKDNAKFTVKDNRVESLTVEYKAPSNAKKTKVTVPETTTYKGIKFKVTSVAAKSFKNNKKVTQVSIASSITKIGDSCFEGCTALKSVTIGKGLVTIGKNAFKNCKKLTKVTIKSTTLKTVGKNALKGVNAKCKIKVPSKQLKKYQKLFKKKGQKSSVKVVK